MSSHTHTEAHDLIVAKFLTDWGTTTPVDYDPNINISKTANTPSDGTTSWVRIVVFHQDSDQISLGVAPNRVFRRYGAVWVQVFTVANIGTYTGRNLAQTALNIFEGTDLDGIWFKNGIIVDDGLFDKWYQHSVKIDFTYDEIK